MHILAVALFWLCVLALFYGHVGYAVLVHFWARRSPQPLPLPMPLDAGGEPLRVNVVVVGHNEQDRIAQRIENLLAQDYPRDRIRISIGSDGSTDLTATRARIFAGEGVEVFEFGAQRGKPAVLNELISSARGDIVVLADARQLFEPGAVRALVERFSDPKVGAVSGELMIAEATNGGLSGGGLYWAYEKFLRKSESRIDSTVGATGAIYAIRRELFEAIPADTVLDDMLIPCQIMKRGYRVVFEPRARAHDIPVAPEQEFQRKVRTLGGNFQLFSRQRWLLDPRQNRAWLQTLSHKILRLACPALMAGALVSSAVLAPRRPFYAAALACQLAFYALAAVGGVLARRRVSIRIFSTPYLFCLLHWATAVGFVRFLRGQATSTWKKAVVAPVRLAPAKRPVRY